MKNKKIVYKNTINQNHLNSNLYKNFRVRYNKTLTNIIKSQDNEKRFFSIHLTKSLDLILRKKILKNLKNIKRLF